MAGTQQVVSRIYKFDEEFWKPRHVTGLQHRSKRSKMSCLAHSSKYERKISLGKWKIFQIADTFLWKRARYKCKRYVLSDQRTKLFPRHENDWQSESIAISGQIRQRFHFRNTLIFLKRQFTVVESVWHWSMAIKLLFTGKRPKNLQKPQINQLFAY